jgi:hypothetical protein
VPFSLVREPKRLTFAVATSAVVDIVVAALLVLATRYHIVSVAALLRDVPNENISG